jgi:hypothetical protein
MLQKPDTKKNPKYHRIADRLRKMYFGSEPTFKQEMIRDAIPNPD